MITEPRLIFNFVNRKQLICQNVQRFTKLFTFEIEIYLCSIVFITYEKQFCSCYLFSNFVKKAFFFFLRLKNRLETEIQSERIFYRDLRLFVAITFVFFIFFILFNFLRFVLTFFPFVLPFSIKILVVVE